MKTINPQSLLTEKVSNVNVSGTISELFSIWINICKEKKVNSNEFDAFVAGYFLGTNFSLRTEFLKKNKKIKYDKRIWRSVIK